MTAPVFTDGVTQLSATVFNALGAEVNTKIALPGGAVTNGQWLKGVGGAVVWSPIVAGDITGATNGQFVKGVGGVGAWSPIVETDVRSLVVADTAWHIVGNSGEPAFQNGWTNFDGIGSGRQGRFRKLASGLVILGGCLKSTTTSGGPIFTLPVGYRPYAAGGEYWSCIGNSAAVGVTVDGGGNVTQGLGAGVVVNGYLMLSLAFFADG